MEKVQLKLKGVNTQGNWFLITKETEGYAMSGYVRPNQSIFDKHDEGEEIEIPTSVVKAVKWQS